MVKTLPSYVGGGGLIPGQGAKIVFGLKTKTSIRGSVVTNLTKTLKVVHIKKSSKK